MKRGEDKNCAKNDYHLFSLPFIVRRFLDINVTGEMNSFEFNKIAAAILIALLTIKGADLISEKLIHPVLLKENVYKIEGVSSTSSQAASPETKKGPAPIEPLLATASAEKGEIVFKKCMSCHTAEKGGPNKIGPDLYGIVDAPKAKHPGYTYSKAMESKGGTWTYDDLNVYLYNPRDFVPGTKMSFAGIKNDQDRADVIAYLRQQSDNPPPLPKVEIPPTSDVKPSEKEKSSQRKTESPQIKPTEKSKETKDSEVSSSHSSPMAQESPER